MMKKFFLCLICGVMILLITGCDDGNSTSKNTNDKQDSLKYTWWQDTNGYILWLLDDECYLSKDDKKLSNTCSFTDNAYNTGKSKIVICNSYGTKCNTNDVSVSIAKSGNAIFSTYGSFYYQGTVNH